MPSRVAFVACRSSHVTADFALSAGDTGDFDAEFFGDGRFLVVAMQGMSPECPRS
jgi:hypothetical protein